MSRLALTHTPELRAPYLVAGFGGWANGGEVSTDVVEFLQSNLTTESLGEITSDGLYIHASPTLASRPAAVIRQGLIESMRFPSNTLHGWRCPEEGSHDLILLQGVEPDLLWQEYVAAILACVERFQVQRVYTIGGYLDHAPHTRTPRISAVVTEAAMRPEFTVHDVDLTDYEGPTGIQSYLLATCQERGVEAVSLWGGTPTYIEGSYPHVAQAILNLLCHMWRLPVDLQPIEEQAAELEGALNAQMDSHPDLADYVKRLEQAYDAARSEQPEVDTEVIVEEIQQFLRQRRQGPGSGA